MAGFTAQGATFTFAGFSGKITGITVESPVAELADMTGISDSASMIVLRPTGAWSGGSIVVDCILSSSVPTAFVRSRGQLTFSSPGFSYAVNAVVESASVTAQAGEVVRGTLRFRPTDYYG
jgi:hypothetical protein